MLWRGLHNSHHFLLPSSFVLYFRFISFLVLSYLHSHVCSYQCQVLVGSSKLHPLSTKYGSWGSHMQGKLHLQGNIE